MNPLLMIAGLVLLVSGAGLLVRGASGIAAGLGVPPLIIGLTVVAFGTSAPELSVSVGAAWSGQVDVALGNVVGSNIFNVLLILGVSALLTPLSVASQLVRLEVPLMIGVSVTVLLLALDGTISHLDGMLLAGLLLAYVLLQLRMGRAEREPSDAVPGPTTPVTVGLHWAVHLASVLVGLALLVLGAQWLVSSAVAVASALGVSELLIGLTLVAAGTSLPELATSVVASLRGERDIAVGNVVGSNIFNLLGVLGLSALVSPSGLPVASEALRLDLPVMLAVALACLPIFITGMVIARWEGAVFLAFYVAYVVYLVLAALGHAALDMYTDAMLGLVVPLLVITLLWPAIREWKKRA